MRNRAGEIVREIPIAALSRITVKLLAQTPEDKASNSDRLASVVFNHSPSRKCYWKSIASLLPSKEDCTGSKGRRRLPPEIVSRCFYFIYNCRLSDQTNCFQHHRQPPIQANLNLPETFPTGIYIYLKKYVKFNQF